jgi:FdhD protein
VTVRPGTTTSVSTWLVEGEHGSRRDDVLATEEPLEIRLKLGARTIPVAVTMRTPGADFELAVGFLYSEGVVRSRDAIHSVSYCVDREIDVEQRYNIVNVELANGEAVDLAPLERHFSVTSACGVCGKASLDGLRRRGIPDVPPGPEVEAAVISSLPDRLRTAQAVFDTTGGLHASGLFSAEGALVAAREDVGRHNALDKVIGWALLNARLPLSQHIVLVSGRASFELVQKAASSGAAVLCSVSAPSSLAVDVAREFGVTLIGFVRGERFKVYSGFERINGAAVTASGASPVA